MIVDTVSVMVPPRLSSIAGHPVYFAGAKARQKSARQSGIGDNNTSGVKKTYQVDIEAASQASLSQMAQEHADAFNALSHLLSLGRATKGGESLTQKEAYLAGFHEWKRLHPEAGRQFDGILSVMEPILRHCVKRRIPFALDKGWNLDEYKNHGFNTAYQAAIRAIVTYNDSKGTLVNYVYTLAKQDLSYEIQHRFNRPTPGVSLDTPLDTNSTGKSSSRKELTASTETEAPEDYVIEDETVAHLRSIIGIAEPTGLLTPNEILILRKRFNLLPPEAQAAAGQATLGEAGKAIGGRTRERSRQLETRALDKLRGLLEKPLHPYQVIHYRFNPGQALALSTYLAFLQHQPAQLLWNPKRLPAYLPPLLQELGHQLKNTPFVVKPDILDRTRDVQSILKRAFSYTGNPAQDLQAQLVTLGNHLGLSAKQISQDLGIRLQDLDSTLETSSAKTPEFLHEADAQKLLPELDSASLLPQVQQAYQARPEAFKQLDEGQFKSLLSRRVALELRARGAQQSSTTLQPVLEKALQTPFTVPLGWLRPFLSPQEQKVLLGLGENPRYLETFPRATRDKVYKRYKALIKHSDSLLQITASAQPYTQKVDFYRTGFLKLQPLKKRAMDDQSVALGYSTTHKLFLLYLDANPDAVQPLVQKLGLVAKTAVESELARLKQLQLTHPEDWTAQWPMAGHKTIELLRRAEEVLYEDLQKEASPVPPITSEPITRESEAADIPQTPSVPPEPSKSHPTRGKWPFHIPAPYLLKRLAEDPLLNRMRLFLNLERRQILDKLPQAENLKKTMPADDYRRYQNMVRSCVKELQAFTDLVTEHIPNETERDAILTYSDAEFIRRVFPILAQHTGKAVYSLVPDVVVPASFKPTEPWKQLTQWSEWPNLTGFQKRILYLRIGERLRPEALTQRLKKDLGLTDDSITVKGIRTVLEKFYRSLPAELSRVARVEPLKSDSPALPDSHPPEESPA